MEALQLHTSNPAPASLDEISRREVTLQDVAQAVEVSVSTVSLVLNDKGRVSTGTRERVKRIARELGFSPNPAAQRLVNGHQDNTIALFSLYLDLNVVTTKLQILQNLLTQRGFSAPIHAFGGSTNYAFGGSAKPESVDQAKIMRELLSLRPRAFACYTDYIDRGALDELRGFSERGGVVVCYDRALDLPCDQVLLDREHNTYLAMRHLLELGHRNIGFYLGHLEHDPLRLKGLQRALNEFDAPLLNEWLQYVGEERYVKGGALLAEFFLSRKERPTAMCIVNDFVATGFITHLLRHGVRVPQDVSVIGHDNVPIGEFGCVVPLSTVSNPVEKIAQQVARSLSERLSGEYNGAPRNFELHGELVVRESTAPLIVN